MKDPQSDEPAVPPGPEPSTPPERPEPSATDLGASPLPRTLPPGRWRDWTSSAWRPDRWPRRRLIRVLALALVLGGVLWFVPPVYRLLDGPVTVTRYDRKKGEVQATVGPGLTGWISNKKISRHALNAIVSAEDGKFYDHHGLDFQEIAKSLRTNLKRGRYARGGSTITQQVVKMAFLGREKTLLRKAREAVGAVLVELLLPKDRILEWYINLAEFGDGVYGIQEGCWHYFKTKPELLSIEQAVHLALVLPSPNAWSRGLRRRSLTSFGHRRFATILNRMRQSGYITKTQWSVAITRGDFGRPVSGYAKLLAADESQKPLCPGNPGCPEPEDPDTDDEVSDLSFPKTNPRLAPPVPVSADPAGTAGAGGTLQAPAPTGTPTSATISTSPGAASRTLVPPPPPANPASAPTQPPPAASPINQNGDDEEDSSPADAADTEDE